MNSGSYRLHILLGRDETIVVGALGKVFFPKGLYIYSGSAMKNLEQRIERHRRKEKPLKWHIDYLLSKKSSKIVKVETFPSEKKEECERNLELLNKPGAWLPVIGFGSSDCRKCPAHLIGIR